MRRSTTRAEYCFNLVVRALRRLSLLLVVVPDALLVPFAVLRLDGLPHGEVGVPPHPLSHARVTGSLVDPRGQAHEGR